MRGSEGRKQQRGRWGQTTMLSDQDQGEDSGCYSKPWGSWGGAGRQCRKEVMSLIHTFQEPSGHFCIILQLHPLLPGS